MTPPSLDNTSFDGADMSNVKLTVHEIAGDGYTDGGNWAGVGDVNYYQ